MDKLVLEEPYFRRSELIKGNPYIIKQFGSIKYSGIFERYSSAMVVFTNAYSIDNTRRIINNGPIYQGSLYLHSDFIGLSYTYHKILLQKYKIQSAMEARAVNLILQQIIGDPFMVVRF